MHLFLYINLQDLIGILNDMQSLGKLVTTIHKLCTANESYKIHNNSSGAIGLLRNLWQVQPNLSNIA